MLGELLRPKTDRGGHRRTQPGCSGGLFAKTAKADWRRTLDKGGQNGDERRETGAKKRLAAASKNATHRRAPQRLAAKRRVKHALRAVVLPNHDRTASLTLGELREFTWPPPGRSDFRCCTAAARDCCCRGERLAGGGPRAGPTMNVHNVIAATQRNCIVCTSKPTDPPREKAAKVLPYEKGTGLLGYPKEQGLTPLNGGVLSPFRIWRGPVQSPCKEARSVPQGVNTRFSMQDQGNGRVKTIWEFVGVCARA